MATAAGAENEHNKAGASRGLRPGIYAPILAFFLPESEDLDLPPFEKHVVRLAQEGVYPVLSGSMGEAPHLSHAERATLIRSARRALDAAHLTQVPIISGVAAGATREAIELAREAADAGADAVIAILNGYFAAALAKDRRALKAYWAELAEQSPLPVMVYNYPLASGGIDLDSELITELAIECPNLAGVKLTCGNVAKLTRICATVSDPSFATLHPRKDPAFPFLVLGGYSDFLVPSLFANAHGAITGLANIAPKSIVHLYNLTQRALSSSLNAASTPFPPPPPALIPIPSVSESETNPHASQQSQTQDIEHNTQLTPLRAAQHMQGIIARADATIAATGVAGTKYLLERVHGYGGAPRRPLRPLVSSELGEHPHVRALLDLENAL